MRSSIRRRETGGERISGTRRKTSRSAVPRSAAKRTWSTLPQEELLDLQFRDLKLRIAGSWLEGCVRRLRHELERRELCFAPHFWLSEEWYSPDGIAGVAIPFYLAHPRLQRLERSMMLEVEGGTRESCLKLLRHETGHAIDHAFGLSRKRRWRELFGRSSKPYPDSYRPNPASRRFVHHLDGWYAQSHPDEDFAETFAVWLAPRSGWRQRYQGWPALAKLEYVDEVMEGLRGVEPKGLRRDTPYEVSHLRKTLRRHYEVKREHYSNPASEAQNADLRRLFEEPEKESKPRGRRRDDSEERTAASFLRSKRRALREQVCRWSGGHAFTVDQVLKDLIEQCRTLGLRTRRSDEALMLDASVFLTVQTQHRLHGKKVWHSV